MEGIWLASYVGLWLLVMVMLLGFLALARQVGLLNRRVPPYGARAANPGPDIGDRAPLVETQDLDGRPVVVGDGGGKRMLVVFLSGGCETCADLVPAIRSLARSERNSTATVVVSFDTEGATREFVARHKLDGIPVVVSGGKVGDAYEISGTPYAVLVDEQGVVRSKGMVNHLEHLESLVVAADLGYESLEHMIHVRDHDHGHDHAVPSPTLLETSKEDR
jgi:methylamine dehydrogenase accessory protein MauD